MSPIIPYLTGTAVPDSLRTARPTPGTGPRKIDGTMPDNAPRPTVATAPQFPTYGDWLTGHDDATLVDLLWRLRAFHTPLTVSLPSRHGAGRSAAPTVPDPLSAVSDVAALRQLDAAALAVLHALVHAGAAHHPVDADALADALTALCDTAGTPADRRPTADSLPGVLVDLASRALVYGPGLRIGGPAVPAADLFPVKVPDHLQALFSGTTDLPWVLVDGYRCPVPTDGLPAVLAALPDRQRRLLDTLASAGGIGHSASLDDPDRPLARMIGAGLLDRVDAGTARLSPRVSAFISDRVVPDPGGDFTVPSPVPVDDRADGAAVARVVETLRQVTDLLTDLGSAPLRPLSGGGIGVREITKAARRTGEDAATVTTALLLCRHADLVATGLPVPAPATDAAGPDGEVWGLTDRGAEFLAADTARRWALLLSGWSTSPHAPWEAEEAGAHLLQDTLDHPRVAALRSAAAELVSVSGADTDPGVQLWRLRPSLAARTTADALAAVLDEAESLGLRAAGAPTGAAAALAAFCADDGSGEDADAPATAALDALTAALTDVLPAPVRMLLVQADLTVLAPGLLDAGTEAMLRRIADIESTGMASVWRISPESLKRAASAGETAERVRGFLAGMAPEIPQGLDYLITDAFRTTGTLTAGTAATVLTAPDAAALDAALASLSDDEVRQTGLRRIAPTVAVSRTQLSVVVDALEDAGVRVGVEGDATASAHGPVRSLVPDPQRPRVTRDEVADQLAAAVEGFRRARSDRHADDGDAGDVPEVETVRDPRAIMDALRSAYDRGTRVEISYVGADGDVVQEWISVVTMSPVTIVGVTESDGASLRIRPHRIAWVGVPA